MNESTTSAIAIAAAIGICYAIYIAYKWIQALKQHYKIFETIGVAGPKPTIFLGNAGEFRKRPGQIHEVQADLIKRYGRITGMFMGSKGRYLLTDPDIIKEITVKQFTKFSNRSVTFNTGFRFDLGVVLLRNEHWKRVRNILTPSFTSSKIKATRPYLNKSTAILMKKLDKASLSGESVNIHQWFSAYTMQIIMATAFATDIDSQTNPDSTLNVRASQCLHLSPFAIITALLLPSFFPYVVKLDRTFTNAMKYMDNLADKVLSMRKSQKNSEHRDLLQLLIHASDEHTKSTLTHDETIGQITTMLFAGHETTSNALGFISYLLALHPEIQDKLIDEIDCTYSSMDSTEIDFDTAMYKMVYLDMVISETLRLYPPTPLIGRDIQEDCIINGVKFLQGFTIGISIYALHKDPEFWEDPEKFDPERFSEERKKFINSYTYLPFGTGPRACIGYRFALMEIKLCLTKILRSYRFIRCPETEVPLRIKAAGSIYPQNGIHLKIEKR